MPDASGLTPLHEACNGGHLSIAKMLVEHMQKVNPKAFAKYIEAKDKGGATVLHYAARRKSEKLVQVRKIFCYNPVISLYYDWIILF